MYLDRKTNALKTVQDLLDNSATSWSIWLETVQPGQRSIFPFDRDNHCLVFYKVFLPEKNNFIYFGYHFALYNTTISMYLILHKSLTLIFN